MLNAYVTLDPIETLYIASLLGDQRRPIDRYIDYFGGRRPHPEVSVERVGPDPVSRGRTLS